MSHFPPHQIRRYSGAAAWWTLKCLYLVTFLEPLDSGTEEVGMLNPVINALNGLKYLLLQHFYKVLVIGQIEAV